MITLNKIDFSDRPSAQPGFFCPKRRETGSAWEHILIYRDGLYYLFFDAQKLPEDSDCLITRDVSQSFTNKDRITALGNVSVAVSRDGVFWHEFGCLHTTEDFIPDASMGGAFQIHDVGGDEYVMTLSCAGRPGLHTEDGPVSPYMRMYLATSSDLLNWTYCGHEKRLNPDPRWYQIEGRWDTPHLEPHPEHGFFGLVDGDSKEDVLQNDPEWQRVAAISTKDGMSWHCHEPVKLETKNAPNTGQEVAGFKKIGDTYFLVMDDKSNCYNTHLRTYWSKTPEGPFYQTTENHILAGPLACYGSMHRIGGEVLITTFIPYSLLPDNKGHYGSWATPVKQCVADGHNLWLMWWKNNEALKCCPVPAEMLPVPARRGCFELSHRFDPQRTSVIEGALTLPDSSEAEENLICNADVTASSIRRTPCGNIPMKEAYFSADQVKDPREENMWIAEVDDEMPWLIIDLHETRRIGRIRIDYVFWGQPAERSIEVSLDGKTWILIRQDLWKHKVYFSTEVVEHLHVDARYIRITAKPERPAVRWWVGMAIRNVDIYEAPEDDKRLLPGIFFEMPDDVCEAVFFDASGSTFHGQADVEGRHFSLFTKRKLKAPFGKIVNFRIVQYGDLIELYVNNCFIQNLALPSSPTGRIGFFSAGNSCPASNVRAWYSN